MLRRVALVGCLVAVATGFAVSANAQGNWAQLGQISSSLGNNSGRVCVGAPTPDRPSDYGCPADAPLIQGGVLTTDTLSATTVNGHYVSFTTLTAGRLYGDGSGLTGITADATDRIVSGTTSMVVTSNTGFVSLTQAGTNTGWFDPQRGLVTLGVSATGPISGSSGYFYDRVAIGTATPEARLHVLGTVSVTDALQVGDSGLVCSAGIAGALRYNGGNLQYCNGAQWLSLVGGGSGGYTDRVVSGTTDISAFEDGSLTFTTGGSQQVVIGVDGSVAVAGTLSATTLNSRHLSSTEGFIGNLTSNRMSVTNDLNARYLSASTAFLDEAAGNVASFTTVNGHYASFTTLSAGRFYGDGSGLTGITADATDRIVSGTTSMVVTSNTGFVSLTQAGTNTGWFDPQRGLVTLGVSATGRISGSDGYFINRVAIGRTDPSGPLHVRAGADMNLALMGDGNGFDPGAFGLVAMNDANNGWVPLSLQASRFSFMQGRVAIGAATPSATLHVVGTVSATDAIQVGDSGLTCTSGIPGAIRYNGGNLQYCNGVSWQTVAGGSGGYTDRIVSGTSNITVNENSGISFTVGGIQRAAFSENGLYITNIANPGITLQTNSNTGGMAVLNFFGGADDPDDVVAAYYFNNFDGSWNSEAVAGIQVNREMDADTAYMRFSTNGGDGNWERMRITGDGNVGIGLVPSAKLDVWGSISATHGTFRAMQPGLSALDIGSYGPSPWHGRLGVGSAITLQGHGEAQNNWVAGMLGSGVYYDDATHEYNVSPMAEYHRAAIEFLNAGTIAFYGESADRQADPTLTYPEWRALERMRITGAGRVGIGTVSPSAQLTVSSSLHVITPGTQDAEQATIALITRSGSSGESFGSANIRGWSIHARGDAYDPSYMQNDLGFSYWDGTGWIDSIYIDSGSGNMGLGTSAPRRRLDILYASGPQFRLTHTDNTIYTDFQTTAGGHLRMNSTGGNVGIGTVTPTATLEVNGTVSATNFVGNGSGLTGVVASAADRIISGTNAGTSMIAISNTGYISITQNNGTNTGWFDPTRGLVSLGVSTTGRISGSSAYFRNNVAIGVSNTTLPLDVQGPRNSYQMYIGANDGWNGGDWAGLSMGNKGAIIFRESDVYASWGRGDIIFANNNGAAGVVGLADERMRIATDGQVGINTRAQPSATFHVVGTVSITDAIQISGTSLPCSTGIPGAIRYSAGAIEYCNGNHWTSLASSAQASADTDRIVSGSAVAYIGPSGTVLMRGRLDIVTGTAIVAIGYDAGRASNAAYGTFVGSGAGTHNLGDYSTFVGHTAGFTNSQEQVTAIGAGAAGENRGAGVVAIGYNAGQFNLGSDAIMIGRGIATGGTPGPSHSVIIGSGIGVWNMTDAERNVFVGHEAARAITGGDDNLVAGHMAGYGLTSGQRNVLLGSYVATNITTGGHNIAIGYNTHLASATGSGQLTIGNAIFGRNVSGTLTDVAEHARIGIKTSDPQTELEVDGTVSASNIFATSILGTASATYVHGRYASFSTVTAGAYFGDGSQLTGVVAAAADRIISGTNAGTSMIAISNTGFISITQNNSTNTGWFDPTRGLVTLGVSSTGPISATYGYFTGPDNDHVVRILASDVPGGVVGMFHQPTRIRMVRGSSSNALFRLETESSSWGGNGDAGGIALIPGGRPVFVADRNYRVAISGSLVVSTTGQITTPTLWAGSNARVGVGTSNPMATVDVVGRISATDAIQVGTSALPCSAGIPGAIRYNAGAIQYCDGTSWTSLASSGAAANPDRIVSGTTNIIANQNHDIVFTTAGSQRAVIDERGYMGLGAAADAIHRLNIQTAEDNSGTGVSINSPAAGRMVLLPSAANGNLNSLVEEGDTVLGFTGGTIGTGNLAIAPWFNGTSGMRMDVLGNISTTGVIQLSHSSIACAGEVSGSIRFNAAGDTLQICTSAGWTSLSSDTSVAGLPDRIVSGTTSITAHENTSLTFTVAGSQRMVIGHDGLIGIGTSLPQASLNVAGNFLVSGSNAVVDVVATGGTLPRLSLTKQGQQSVSLEAAGDGGGLFINSDSGSSDYRHIQLQTNAITRLFIHGDGNVGMGTTAPSATAHVSGSLLIAGNDNEPCATGMEGLIRKNPSNGRMEFCR